jgi:hypothetical protein
MKVYITVHNEVFADVEDSYRIDGMVQFVTDTKEKALAYMNEGWCNSYSYWELSEIDGSDAISLGYFGPRGGKRPVLPLTKQLIQAFKKARQSGPQHLN